MREITLEELLEAGCHFGHQVNRRNPKADPFIFEARSNINIINLEKTKEGLIKAANYLKDISSKNGSLIFVGTKRQAKEVVKEEIDRALKSGAKNIFYVTSRWIGGVLTNFDEVTKNLKKLKDLRLFLEEEQKQGYTKREIILFEKEKAKLENLYGGIVDLDRIPDALFIIDTHLETTAVREAIKTDVKTVGIVDTNADPTIIDYPIPANDDAVGSVKAIVNYIVDAWIEGQKEIKNQTSNIKNEDKAEVSEEKKEEKSVKKEVKKAEKVSGKKKEEKKVVSKEKKEKVVTK